LSSAVHHTSLKTLAADKITADITNGDLLPFVALPKNYLIIKQAFDILFSFSAILLLCWLLPIIAMTIKLDSKGPVFFRQKRIGRNGRVFACIKFRTMRLNDEADEKQAEKNDERITATGKFLRLTNMDELPQLYNVLIGDMSIVGPRPHMVSDCIRFSFIIPSYSFRNLVRPGITGWAQVNGHHGPTMDYESVTNRYYWDARYVREINAWLDIKILLKTGWRVINYTGKILKTFF